MILDKFTMFSHEQSLISAAGDVVSDVLDTGAGANVGEGNPLQLSAWITTTCVGATATVALTLKSSASSDMSSPQTDLTLPAVAVASLVAGYQFKTGGFVPKGTLRYLQITYTIATAALTAGAVSAGINLDRPTELLG